MQRIYEDRKELARGELGFGGFKNWWRIRMERKLKISN
jgi:hypothetical protein